MYKSCLNRQSSLNNWFSSFGGNLTWYSYHQNLWMSGFQIIQLLQSNTAMFFQWCHFYSYKSRAVLSAILLALVKMGVFLRNLFQSTKLYIKGKLRKLASKCAWQILVINWNLINTCWPARWLGNEIG